MCRYTPKHLLYQQSLFLKIPQNRNPSDPNQQSKTNRKYNNNHYISFLKLINGNNNIILQQLLQNLISRWSKQPIQPFNIKAGINQHNLLLIMKSLLRLIISILNIPYSLNNNGI